jgi:hypothetical protein
VGTIASGVSALCRSVGEVVLYRDVQKGGVWWVIPHVVVSDDGDCVVLYTAPGTPTASMVGLTEETFAEVIGRQGYSLGQTYWEDNHVLRILKAGAGHAVELYWSAEEWTFHGWYVHLQTPYRRTPAGFEKRDQALDILVDLEHGWTWKDEHHIALLTDAGYLDADEVTEIWREANAVTRRIDAWGPPFCDGWDTWRPDDAWVDAVRTFRRADLNHVDDAGNTLPGPYSGMTFEAMFSSDDLRHLLEGDVTLVDRALALRDNELAGLWLELEGFVLRPEHVVRVLRDLRGGSITREQANRWGSFIFLDGGEWLPLETPDWVRTEDDLHRFVIEHADQAITQEKTGTGDTPTIDIPYEAESEEPIVEAIAMLDSVADIEFSGENIDDQLDQLIDDLSRS